MNSFGSKFRISIFGESHGEAIGVTIDGVPSGMAISEADIRQALDRRKSGALGTTSRKESDEPHFISGYYNGRTTGAPLTVIFHNDNTRSKDYSQFVQQPRPGHADFTAAQKFGGFNDPRGGGHFSGRMTLCLVTAGLIARQLLDQRRNSEQKIRAHSEIVRLGGFIRQSSGTYLDPIDSQNLSADEILLQTLQKQDSIGAVLECKVTGVPVGCGEPFFDSLESVISHLVFSIPGVRGIEFGDGFAASDMYGSQHNDPITDAQGHTAKNGCGGINGGISNGNELVFRVAFKPTSSIAQAQKTFNFKSGEMEELRIGGRHDACFALRCPVIVEAVTYIALAQFI